MGAPTFGTTLTGAGPLDAATGRRGLWAWYVDSPLLFSGKPLHPAGTIRGETIYVDPLSADPLAGLERYADAMAAFQHVTPWAARGHAIPTG